MQVLFIKYVNFYCKYISVCVLCSVHKLRIYVQSINQSINQSSNQSSNQSRYQAMSLFIQIGPNTEYTE